VHTGVSGAVVGFLAEDFILGLDVVADLGGQTQPNGTPQRRMTLA
jgi:hypothetical protein